MERNAAFHRPGLTLGAGSWYGALRSNERDPGGVGRLNPTGDGLPPHGPRERGSEMGKRVAVGAGLLFLATLLGLGQACPTVAVVIPETVIIHRVPRPIPDPAAETAVIREFLQYGINLVELVHVRLLRATPDGLARTQDLARRALAGDQVAIRELAVGNGVATDILVVGEAVSTVEVFEALRVPGRASVQDGRARVEVRAIEVATGRILAADALHTGGVDFSAELAGKKSLERAGDKIACRLAHSLARNYPLATRCFRGCTLPVPTFGALPFDNQSGVWVGRVDLGQLFATTTETALSERGCTTAQALAADYVVTGTITDWREIRTSYINLPLLDVLFRAIACWVTVDVRVLDLSTAEFRAHQITVNVGGVEIFGFRFGASPRDIARAVAKEIAARVSAGWKGR